MPHCSPLKSNTAIGLALLTFLPLLGCGRSVESPSLSSSESGTNSQRRAQMMQLVSQVQPQVEAFCGDCHAMPRPASSSRNEWVDEINQGFTLYGESGRSDLQVPPYDDVLKFFQYQAPDELDHWTGRLD